MVMRCECAPKTHCKQIRVREAVTYPASFPVANIKNWTRQTTCELGMLRKGHATLLAGFPLPPHHAADNARIICGISTKV